MRFRARLPKAGQDILLQILTSFEKNGSSAVLFLTEESVKIALVPTTGETPHCYAELSVRGFQFLRNMIPNYRSLLLKLK